MTHLHDTHPAPLVIKQIRLRLQDHLLWESGGTSGEVEDAILGSERDRGGGEGRGGDGGAFNGGSSEGNMVGFSVDQLRN